MAFDYSRLLGKIKERGFSQKTLARAVGMSPNTLSVKLGNKAFFTQKEMKKISSLLLIAQEDIGVYFFVEKVQKN